MLQSGFGGSAQRLQSLVPVPRPMLSAHRPAQRQPCANYWYESYQLTLISINNLHMHSKRLCHLHGGEEDVLPMF